jgi:hypothetical protein
MSTDASAAHEEQAARFVSIAEEAAKLADHARIAAAHFRSGEVSRAGAHALALQGHLIVVRNLLDEVAVVHSTKANRTQ